ASGIPSLQEVDGSNKGNGNDEVGSGIGNSGRVPIDGVLNSGAKINVDGATDLIRTIDALVRGSIIGGGGGGGGGVNIDNGIRNGGNGYDVGETRDSSGVGMASNLSTSDFEGNGICICGQTNILRWNYAELEQEQSKLGAPPLPPHLGDTAAGSGYSLARNTSSAGGRYSGPRM
nr:hypothetical protein [Tanacetum cinerariifolium]